jgi:hypothetical protein
MLPETTTSYLCYIGAYTPTVRINASKILCRTSRIGIHAHFRTTTASILHPSDE